jgi:hypothetical protein
MNLSAALWFREDPISGGDGERVATAPADPAVWSTPPGPRITRSAARSAPAPSTPLPAATTFAVRDAVPESHLWIG